MHGGGGSGGTESTGNNELFSIGGCDVGISGKSTLSNLPPPIRGTFGQNGQNGQMDVSRGTGVPGLPGVQGGTALTGSRAGSEFDISLFGSPNQSPKGNVSKEVNLSFI